MYDVYAIRDTSNHNDGEKTVHCIMTERIAKVSLLLVLVLIGAAASVSILLLAKVAFAD